MEVWQYFRSEVDYFDNKMMIETFHIPYYSIILLFYYDSYLL